ncbi:polysaccharide lyase family 14 protein [Hypholoma sublateritium FD-334 SS-4]|uniref:Polysaccharide lyase family 14 protein n=1 Tax=Hypholoma sublateritium (strain FD-334 SS-4) TaxID=945553 RepID=A0A0D2MC75_HYPSF|nr:polysaccharide lyase family 14 protein [Hypholoma sublateritium FD-334 SS-4]
MKIVTGIPASASASPLAAAAADGDSGAGATRWDNATSVLQILYPAGTIDPAQSPVGGADFYAAPLDIDGATSVTLSYSVFVPADFDWVRGGKMPGLYGGHTGCSGGNSAIDCFSTRLMWRAGGAGELYLYAPKDKQTKALCGDPRSVCDAAYGLSVGRGTFQWTAGAWTKVEQTVILNTPGQQDGTFVLLVNGERKIARNDVFYPSAYSFTGPVRAKIEITFFGGHEPEYATPRDQYVWFKDFALAHNS